MRPTNKIVISLLTTVFILTSLITVPITASATSVITSDTNITVYYPNGDWGLTPVKLANIDMEENIYLFALKQLIDPEELPVGCYDEFPEEFQIYDINVQGETAYIDIDDIALKNSGVSIYCI